MMVYAVESAQRKPLRNASGCGRPNVCPSSCATVPRYVDPEHHQAVAIVESALPCATSGHTPASTPPTLEPPITANPPQFPLSTRPASAVLSIPPFSESEPAHAPAPCVRNSSLNFARWFHDQP